MQKQWAKWLLLGLLFCITSAQATIYMGASAAMPPGAHRGCDTVLQRAASGCRPMSHPVVVHPHPAPVIHTHPVPKLHPYPHPVMHPHPHVPAVVQHNDYKWGAIATAANQRGPLFFTIRGASLRENIRRIVKHGHWQKFIWKLSYDYHWVGSASIRANSVEDAVAQLLKPYPLQAIFYHKNHVVVVVPRTKDNV